MQRHPSVVPFLVHISNEAKHVERFAVRSKVMTLRPDGEAGAVQGRAGGGAGESHSSLSAAPPLHAPATVPAATFSLAAATDSLAPARPPPAAGNRYVKHFRSIRTIQDYLVKSGEGGSGA